MKERIKRIHFIGIGGSGMCGIAEIVHNMGFQVSGSDKVLSGRIRYLRKLGISVSIGHRARNAEEKHVVVYSAAVQKTNVELRRAVELNIPILRRAEMLGELLRMKYSIGISGTHGKTTTTSMTGAVLTCAKLDPTIIVGGIVRQLGTGAVHGKGHYLIAEADEFDRSFLQMNPTIGVITTLEADHLDCYGNVEEIKEAFVTFANNVPFYGMVIVCLDDPSIQSIINRFNKSVVTYGFSSQADYRILNRKAHYLSSEFSVGYKGEKIGKINLSLPGIHNVNNALAAVAVGRELQIPFHKIKKALENFKGVRRRFELKACIKGITLIDDYAHHPTEIAASLEGAREATKGRIIAVFQPHLYSRTRDFCKEFGRSFLNCDLLIITDIFAAREKPLPGITGEIIANAATESGHRNVHYIPKPSAILSFLKGNLKAGDMLITIGAGDVWKTCGIIENFLKSGRARL
ncbi:MAG: UDP-N-acetylmuramate--L-alanine ligase [bacterium]